MTLERLFKGVKAIRTQKNFKIKTQIAQLLLLVIIIPYFTKLKFVYIYTCWNEFNKRILVDVFFKTRDRTLADVIIASIKSYYVAQFRYIH